MPSEQEDFPATVKILTAPGGVKVYVVGTAHFSEESVKDVELVIQRVRPKAVVLELCHARVRILELDEEAIKHQMDNFDFRDLVKQLGVSGAITHYLMLRMSMRITELMGVAPGGEFRAGFRQAMTLPGCRVFMGDRLIATTWKRAMAQMGLWAKLKMFVHLLVGVGNLTKEEVEAMKQTDMLTELLAQLAGEYPALTQVVLYERDQYLAKTIWNAAGYCFNQYQRAQQGDYSEEESESAEDNAGDNARHRHHSDSTEEGERLKEISKCSVVAVVGIGHVSGIVGVWENAGNIDLTELNRKMGERYLQMEFHQAEADQEEVAGGTYAYQAGTSTRIIMNPSTGSTTKLQASMAGEGPSYENYADIGGYMSSGHHLHGGDPTLLTSNLLHSSSLLGGGAGSLAPSVVGGPTGMGGGGAPSTVGGGVLASRKPCNCNKSNCLKLYCECFSQGQLCQNCNCSNCMNNLNFEQERSRAVKMILERNPQAFHPKIGRGEGERKHTKGCNCKRSGCLKNYCECYEAKISCSDLCRCQGCRNTEDSIDRRSLLRLGALELSRLKFGTSVTKHLVQRVVETMPHSFLTWEVIESVLHCLLGKATEADRKDLSPAAQEKLIMTEFGRALQQIIEIASKAQPPSGAVGLSSSVDPLSGLFPLDPSGVDTENMLLSETGPHSSGRNGRHAAMAAYHDEDLMDTGNPGTSSETM